MNCKCLFSVVIYLTPCEEKQRCTCPSMHQYTVPENSNFELFITSSK